MLLALFFLARWDFGCEVRSGPGWVSAEEVGRKGAYGK